MGYSIGECSRLCRIPFHPHIGTLLAYTERGYAESHKSRLRHTPYKQTFSYCPSRTKIFGRTKIGCKDVEHSRCQGSLSQSITMFSHRIEEILIPIDDSSQSTCTGIRSKVREVAHGYFFDAMDSEWEYILPCRCAVRFNFHVGMCFYRIMMNTEQAEKCIATPAGRQIQRNTFRTDLPILFAPSYQQ